MTGRKIFVDDNNIGELREQYPQGLHFVVGDIHGESSTLELLMNKITFDPMKDHIFFVGDYNEGGYPTVLLRYMSRYYQTDYMQPGFHMIRGNHEWELNPIYPLTNLPDIIVIRGKQLNYYICHAGMVWTAFMCINKDIGANPDQTVFAYRLDKACVEYDAPLRQIIWSRRGLYSQKSKWQTWPKVDELYDHYACIIHGHTPYCYFANNYFSYGDNNLYWEKQHIWFSEELSSFDIDSNIKGRFENGETYRGLACICLEVLEENAALNDRYLTTDAMVNGQNGVFGVPYVSCRLSEQEGDINRILRATPQMKTISLNEEGHPVIDD